MAGALAYRLVLRPDDRARRGFCTLYSRAFSEPPYLQTYPRTELQGIWEAYVHHCLVIAEDEDQVVGLGCFCSLLSNTARGAAAFLSAIPHLPFAPSSAVYMAARAVAVTHRGIGVGTAIAHLGLEWGHSRGFGFYVARTAAEGSHSLGSYSRLGATRFGEVQVKADGSRRVYYWGRIADVLGRSEHGL